MLLGYVCVCVRRFSSSLCCITGSLGYAMLQPVSHLAQDIALTLHSTGSMSIVYSLTKCLRKAWEHSAGIICFPSLQNLAEDVSNLFAQEIQKALVGKPAEQARAAAGQLLQWKGDADQDGYLLLKSVYVLTGTDSATLGRVTESGLPALLLQCLYLFFVFPMEKGEIFESDVQIQKMFVQMLLNICSESQGLQGLLSGNELQSLVIATTCLREHSCCFWKEPIFCVLRAISKAQNLVIIQYLQGMSPGGQGSMDCIKISLQNLTRLADTLPAPEVSEVVNLILAFVKDSHPVSSVLLLEFENGEGYPLLLKVLLRYEEQSQSEVDPHLEELLELVMWLTTCGRSELKVFDSVTYPQLEGFKFHQEASGGSPVALRADALQAWVTVKNLQAFQVLQNVFQRASNSILCTKVLLAIRTMWSWNPRNFFLLEWTLQPISQFVEIVPLKLMPVQMHFFQLLEFLVFELHYVPHEILQKVQHLIKESPESPCALVALQSVLRISGGDLLFTDIFRDSGLLGLLLAQLRKQAKILRKSGNKESTSGAQCSEKELTCVMLRTVDTLLKGSVRNAVVLKDHGMVPFIKIFLDDESYRAPSLSILEQLSVINAEEYMSIIVGALCSSTQGELQLKLDLLKSLLRILETAKGRAAFRVSSGFNGLLSLLSDLEGSLQEPAMPSWGLVSPSQTLDLILHTLCAMAAALHLDPVNGDFFRRNGLFEKLAEDLCLLGCFGALEKEDAPPHTWSDTKARPFTDFLSVAFSSTCPLPPKIQSCLQILGFLDSMAGGSLHLRVNLKESLWAGRLPRLSAQKGEAGSDCQGSLKQWPDLEERTDDSDSVIMHPGVLCIMVRLLPRLYHDDHPQGLESQLRELTFVPSPSIAIVILIAIVVIIDIPTMLIDASYLEQASTCIWALVANLYKRFKDTMCLDTGSIDVMDFGPSYPKTRITNFHATMIWVPQMSIRLLSKEIQCSLTSHIQSLVKSEKNRQVMCEAGMLRTLMTSCRKDLTSSSSPLHSGLIRIFEKLASQAIEPDVLRYWVLSPCSRALARAGHARSQAVAAEATEGPMGATSDASPCPAVTQAPRSSGEPRGSSTALQTTLSLISMTSPRNLQPQKAALAPSFVEFDMSVEGYGRHSRVPDGHPLYFFTLVRHLARTEQPFVCFSVSLCPEDLSLVVSTEEKEFQPLDVMEPEDDPEPSAGRQLRVRCGSLLACGQWHHLAVVVTKEMKRNCTISTYLDGQVIGSAKMLYIQALPGSFLSMDPSSFVDVYGYIATPRVWKQKSTLVWRLGPTYLFEEAISMETLEVINKLGPRYCGEDPGMEATPLVAEEKLSFGLHVASSSTTSIADIRNTYNEVDSRLIAKEMSISSRDNATPVFLLRNCAGHLLGPLRTIGAVAVGQLGVRVFHSSPAASSLDFIGGPAILLGLISLATDDHTMYAAVKVLHSVLTSNPMCDRLMKHISGYQIMAFLLRKKTSLLNHRTFQLILSIAGTAELGFGSPTTINLGVFQHILCNFELWMNTADNLELSLFSHLMEILQSPREGPRNAKVAHQAWLIPKLVFLFNEPGLTPSKIPTIIAILGCQLRGYFSIRDFLRLKEEMFLNLGPDWFLLFVQGHLHPSTTVLGLKLLLHFLSNPSLRGRFKEGLSAGSWVERSCEGVDIVMGECVSLCQGRGCLTVGCDNLKSQPPMPDQSACQLPGFRVLNDFLAHHVHIPEVYLIVSTFLLQTPFTELMDGPKDSLDAMFQWLLQKHHREEVLRIGLCTEGALLLLELLKAAMSQSAALFSSTVSHKVCPQPSTGSEDRTWEQTFPASVLQFLGLVHSTYPQDPAWRTPEFLQTLAAVTFPWETHKVQRPQQCNMRRTSGRVSYLLGASVSLPVNGLMRSLPIHASEVDVNVLADGTGHSCGNFLLFEGAMTQSTQNASSAGAEAEDSSTVEGLQAFSKSHPTWKQLREFTQLLLKELLFAAHSPKQWLPLDVFLEASPGNATSQQKRDFQSEILLSTMEIFHVMSGGEKSMLRGSKDPQPNTEAAAVPSLANISYFSQKLVEKLYSGMFSADPIHILNFITEHIMVVRTLGCHSTDETHAHLLSICMIHEDLLVFWVIENASSQKDTTISVLYSSLNKVILYCLSKPQQSLSECLSLLSVLGFLQEHWDVIFATYNSNISFLTCLTHCFLLLSSRRKDDISAKKRIHYFGRAQEEMNGSDVQHSIQKRVRTLWQQLIAQRRQELEDNFKTDLSVKPGESEVKIEEVTPLCEEMMLKSWQHYLASEKKSLSGRSNAGHHSKVTSWSESLSSAMRLMPGRQAKDPEYKIEDFVSCIENHRRRGQELYASLYKDHVQRQRCGNIKAANAWARIQEQLFGELGLWGQKTEAPPCSRWELDWREGPARMKKRIRRLSPWEAPNPRRLTSTDIKNQELCQVHRKGAATIAYVHSERFNPWYGTSTTLTSTKAQWDNVDTSVLKEPHDGHCLLYCHPAVSQNCHRTSQRFRHAGWAPSLLISCGSHQNYVYLCAAADELTPNEAESKVDEVAVDCTQLTFFPALHESLHSEDFLELCRERQVILQELLDHEKVMKKYSLVIVQGHLVSEGVLLFGNQHFYICENFTLSPMGDVYCTHHCLSNISDPFIFNMCSKDRSSDRYSCQRHSYGDLRELQQARFLLQDIALEIFFRNGYSKFLVFHNGDRSKAFKSFCSFQSNLKGRGIMDEPLNVSYSREAIDERTDERILGMETQKTEAITPGHGHNTQQGQGSQKVT
ncbi:WD repeat- and FYVE domain-containing protein 4 [Galemys pyrenaicus]|uniref:WD repeat- and FYVE domain-containing protein 4 n=1 Tax=Galemys pyrenaicus TaxID=202257 RepID=A0A8J6ADK6_GALPY|nr:WD repeat- and FYVE domain-containing protein 4 [Galemys pyrenaicus]